MCRRDECLAPKQPSLPHTTAKTTGSWPLHDYRIAGRNAERGSQAKVARLLLNGTRMLEPDQATMNSGEDIFICHDNAFKILLPMKSSSLSGPTERSFLRLFRQGRWRRAGPPHATTGTGPPGAAHIRRAKRPGPSTRRGQGRHRKAPQRGGGVADDLETAGPQGTGVAVAEHEALDAATSPRR